MKIKKEKAITKTQFENVIKMCPAFDEHNQFILGSKYPYNSKYLEDCVYKYCGCQSEDK